MGVFTRTDAEGKSGVQAEYVEGVYERRKEKLTIKYNKKGSVW